MVRIVSDMESQQRGYVLTGDETYLPQVKASTEAYSKPAEELRKMLTDQSRAQMLASVKQAADAKMDYCNKSVELYRSAGRTRPSSSSATPTASG